MANPEDVNPKNFKVLEVIYNLNNFSIAWGIWENGDRVLAMRWNSAETEAGYPKAFGNPMWFILPKELTLPLLNTLQLIKNVPEHS
jgi:hypothetical protein